MPGGGQLARGGPVSPEFIIEAERLWPQGIIAFWTPGAHCGHKHEATIETTQR